MIAEATEGLADTPSGRVVINSEPLFATKVIAPLLPKFHADLPGIELRLIASHDLADLDRFEADMAIRFSHKGVLDVPSDLISDAHLYPYAAPDLVPGNRLLPEHLRQFRLYRDRSELVWTRWCAQAGFDPALVDESAWRLRGPLAMEAVIHRDGLYLGSDECAQAEVAAGRLMRLSDVGLSLGAFHLLTSDQAGRRKGVRQARAWLLAQTAHLRVR